MVVADTQVECSSQPLFSTFYPSPVIPIDSSYVIAQKLGQRKRVTNVVVQVASECARVGVRSAASRGSLGPAATLLRLDFTPFPPSALPND